MCKTNYLQAVISDLQRTAVHTDVPQRNYTVQQKARLSDYLVGARIRERPRQILYV